MSSFDSRAASPDLHHSEILMLSWLAQNMQQIATEGMHTTMHFANHEVVN